MIIQSNFQKKWVICIIHNFLKKGGHWDNSQISETKIGVIEIIYLATTNWQKTNHVLLIKRGHRNLPKKGDHENRKPNRSDTKGGSLG